MTLKFATGVQKGRPLETANMPYRIVERNGEEVALFRNGAMARFYRDTTQLYPPLPKPLPPPPAAPPPPNIVSPVLSSYPWPADGRTPVTMATEEVPDEPPRGEAGQPELAIAPEFLTGYPRWTVAKYDPRQKRRWSNPVYAVQQDGRTVYNADRLEVGTGPREYLWLYQKLRELGRGRLQALLEARTIYFL